MDVIDIVNRATPPEPWREGDTIPWNDPEFSKRMLKEHLSQDHDLASRRLATIDRHVAWIHATLLGGRSGAKILDLGCGPGLYGERLSLLEHEYTGIDYSPASVEYARQMMQNNGLSCKYILGDLRDVSFGENNSYDLVMQIFGEINVFRPSHARLIMRKALGVLKPGGKILIEASSEASIRARSTETTRWYSSSGGLFSARPHLVLEETFWAEQHKTLTNRFYVLDAHSEAVERFASSYQAYTDYEYHKLFTESGFTGVTILPGLGDNTDSQPGEFLAITAQKPMV
jgi:ubiquinone/menaquinone biosynthesis C-methylase UbiE